jgi:hypothetical protein
MCIQTVNRRSTILHKAQNYRFNRSGAIDILLDILNRFFDQFRWKNRLTSGSPFIL